MSALISLKLSAPYNTGQNTLKLLTGMGSQLVGCDFPMLVSIGGRTFKANSVVGDTVFCDPLGGAVTSYPAATPVMFQSIPPSSAGGGGGAITIGPGALAGNPTTAPAAPVDVTLGTGLEMAGSTLNATAQAGANNTTVSAVLGQSGPIQVGSNAAGNYVTAPLAGTFIRWDISCVTGPSGAALILDVYKSPDQGVTWVSLWPTNTANRPTVGDGANGSGGTAFDTAKFAAGDWLRFDVVQTGSKVAGQNVSVQLLTAMG